MSWMKNFPMKIFHLDLINLYSKINLLINAKLINSWDKILTLIEKYSKLLKNTDQTKKSTITLIKIVNEIEKEKEKYFNKKNDW